MEPVGTIGSRIRAARMHAGLTQHQLSRITDITPGVIARFECDRCSPSAESIKRLAIGLNVSVDYLLGLTAEFRRMVCDNEICQQYWELTRADQKLATGIMEVICKHRGSPIRNAARAKRDIEDAVDAIDGALVNV